MLSWAVFLTACSRNGNTSEWDCLPTHVPRCVATKWAHGPWAHATKWSPSSGRSVPRKRPDSRNSFGRQAGQRLYLPTARQGRDLRLHGRTGPGGAQMFVPHNFAVALLMMITSAVCWGSWANTYKGVKNYRFELFYWDYAVGIFFISLVLAFTLGSTPHDSSSFLSNASTADGSNIISTLIGGALFNLANLLLVAGIDMAGLATSFPVAISNTHPGRVI